MAWGSDSAGYCQTDACHVPLPQIQNGDRKAYALKSKELTGPTKGVIFLEIDVIFNAVSLSFAFLSVLLDFFLFYKLLPTLYYSLTLIPLLFSSTFDSPALLLSSFCLSPPSLVSISSLVPCPSSSFWL